MLLYYYRQETYLGLLLELTHLSDVTASWEHEKIRLRAISAHYTLTVLGLRKLLSKHSKLYWNLYCV